MRPTRLFVQVRGVSRKFLPVQFLHRWELRLQTWQGRGDALRHRPDKVRRPPNFQPKMPLLLRVASAEVFQHFCKRRYNFFLQFLKYFACLTNFFSAFQFPEDVYFYPARVLNFVQRL